MKLYDYARAPNPRRVRWMMAENDITDIEIVSVDLVSGEHKAPEYRNRIGLAHVPALELDDGTCISESLAICRYLESLYPEPNLFGRDPREQAVIEMWTRRCEIYLANPMMLAVRHTHPGLALMGPQNPEVGTYNLAEAGKMMKTLNRQRADRELIAADRFTMADLVTVTGLDFARLIQYAPPEEFEHFNRWLAACRARPAAKAGV